LVGARVFPENGYLEEGWRQDKIKKVNSLVVLGSALGGGKRNNPSLEKSTPTMMKKTKKRKLQESRIPGKENKPSNTACLRLRIATSEREGSDMQSRGSR